MKPIVLRGQPAFSSFRIAALLRRIRQAAPNLGFDRLDSIFVYFVETDRELSGSVLEHARALLEATEFMDPVVTSGLFVTPRKGTISPWSSKATDIFRNCGIGQVSRVERGMYLRLLAADGRALNLTDLRPALGALHDRMTEGVYTDVSDIFRHLEPRPLVTIPLHRDGIAEGPGEGRRMDRRRARAGELRLARAPADRRRARRPGDPDD